MISESFKSPFYKYYDEWKWESLPNLDLSKISSENDVLHRSAAELIRWGWTYTEKDKTWSAPSIKPKTNIELNFVGEGKNDKNKSKNPFEAELWRSIELWYIEAYQNEGSLQNQVEDPNFIRTG